MRESLLKSFFPWDTLLGDTYSLAVFNNALWNCWQIYVPLVQKYLCLAVIWGLSSVCHHSGLVEEGAIRLF